MQGGIITLSAVANYSSFSLLKAEECSDETEPHNLLVVIAMFSSIRRGRGRESARPGLMRSGTFVASSRTLFKNDTLLF